MASSIGASLLQRLHRSVAVRQALSRAGSLSVLRPPPARRASSMFSFDTEIPASKIEKQWVTTAAEFPGCRITASHGIVRGVVVRSRFVVVDFFAQLQMMLGGNVSLYSDLCERARSDAMKLMLNNADVLGANAIIGVRYESSTMQSASEILCYGTAVTLVSADDDTVESGGDAFAASRRGRAGPRR